MKEYGRNSSVWTEGQSVSIEYGTGYTKVRSSGENDILSDSDDIITTYVFDGYGRCVSSYSTDVSGTKIYGASSGAYEEDNEKAENQIKISSVISDLATNYLVNSGFEVNGVSSLSGWSTSGSVSTIALSNTSRGTNSTFNLTPYDKDYMVRMTVGANGSASISQSVYLKAGTYTLSGDIYRNSYSDVDVTLKAQPASGSALTEKFHFDRVYDYPESAEASLTFDVPSDGTYTVSLMSPRGLTKLIDFFFNEISIPYSYFDFLSSENSDTANRPRLLITYRDQFGLEDYWTYISQSAGSAGTGSINLSNGNLAFSVGTLTTTDSLMPFTPTLIYNSSLTKWYYTRFSRSVPYSNATTGGGFKTNINQCIVPRTYVNASGTEETYYVYTDADGTEHAFFLSTKSGESNIYYDEDGLGLKLTVGTSDFTLTDSGFNVYTFTKKDANDSYTYAGGYLSQIADSNGNIVAFDCNDYGRPTKVKLKPCGA